MANPTDFVEVQAGVPFARRVRVTGGKSIWNNVNDVEARMQVRAGKDESTTLLFDFTPHLLISFDDDDLLVDWNLNGQVTRTMRTGYYDLFVSDVGAVDVRAVRVLFGEIKVSPATTRGIGST